MNEEQQFAVDLAYSCVNKLCEELDEQFASIITSDGPMPPPELSSQITALKDARHALARITTALPSQA